MTVQLIYCRLN